MGTDSDSRAWWAERERKRIEAAEAMSEQWRSENPERKYPDLDFRPPDCPMCFPDCPMCFEETRYEDGQLICDVCLVMWPSNGYGQDAEFIGDPTDDRHDEQEG